MQIPSNLIPKCSDDHSDVTMNLRADDTFVEDEGWHKASETYYHSLRREAFCNRYQKDFELKPMRGNIETRIRKVYESDLDATIMAEAGIKRLNLTKYIKQVFSLDYITPPAGQGALAIITRKDSDKKEAISKLNDYTSMQEVFAEKKVLEELGVGCQWPIGSIARMKENQFNIYSILLTKEGNILKEQTEKGSIKNAVELGKKIGRLFEDYV